MQIFASDSDPYECAKALDDLRLNKLILESSQLLSAALFIHGVDKKILPCKPGWHNHPLAKWTAQSRKNYKWLYYHFLFLLQEFSWRREKHHAYLSHKNFYLGNINNIPDGSLTQFINCTTFKNDSSNIHEIYKKYLILKWNNDKRHPRWTKRGRPHWAQ